MNFKKIVQVVNYVLSKYDYKLNYTKLIKLLYIADRLCLERYAFAISNDKYCSMGKGPVLSGLYDFIQEKNDSRYQSEWNSFFYTSNYDLISRIKGECDYGEMSAAEIEILNEIDNKYHNNTYSEMIDITHTFPEWNSPAQNTSMPLPIEKILSALGKTPEEIKIILDREQNAQEAKKILGIN